MATAAILRISRLRNLIEHPRTGDAERAAVQRMLDRLMLKFARDATNTGNRTHGARYDRAGRHAGLAGIADMISDDIALGRVVSSTASRPSALRCGRSPTNWQTS